MKDGSVDFEENQILAFITQRILESPMRSEMRVYLDGLNDQHLEMPFQENMKVWNVLYHVVNHGTAHRAQIGARLRHLGLKPPPQDYIHFTLESI